MSGIICMPSIFEYKNCKFEVHSYFGPCPLDENDIPYVDIPDEFWDLYDEFSSLSEEEKESRRIQKGGCYTINC